MISSKQPCRLLITYLSNANCCVVTAYLILDELSVRLRLKAGSALHFIT